MSAIPHFRIASRQYLDPWGNYQRSAEMQHVQDNGRYVRPLMSLPEAEGWPRVRGFGQTGYDVGAKEPATRCETQVLIRNRSDQSIRVGAHVMGRAIVWLPPRSEVLLDLNHGDIVTLGATVASLNRKAAFCVGSAPQVCEIGEDLCPLTVYFPSRTASFPMKLKTPTACPNDPSGHAVAHSQAEYDALKQRGYTIVEP